MQRHVDRYYRMFVESVARNRNTSVKQVESEFGQGRIVGAQDAVRRGMAERVGTLDEAVPFRPPGPRVPIHHQFSCRERTSPIARVITTGAMLDW